MLQHLPLVLALVIPPDSLSLEAGEHNTKAMRYYDAGQLAPAVDEFYAAYQLMPDARRDLPGRELLLGSMRATLRALHAETGDPAPLCRLQTILQIHADALLRAFPDDPNKLETRSARARHAEGAQQLAPFGPDACKQPEPEPEPVVAVLAADEQEEPLAPVPAAPPPLVSKPPSDTIPPRHLNIAGGVTFGLGAALLGVMTYGIVGETRHRRRIEEIDAAAAGRRLLPREHAELLDRRQRAHAGRILAIGTGVAAGVSIALAATLFVLARRSARTQRWSAAPWWSPGGAGMTLRVQFGTTF